MNAEDVRDVLRKNFTTDSQAIVFEVPNGLASGRNNSGKTRFADAIVCEMWRSRGFEMQGFEIKVSRSDWKHELAMPAKAESHFERCDRWWLITPHQNPPIALRDEIPGPWGHMVVDDKGKLITLKKAPKLVPARKFDLEFAFALVRAASRYDGKAISAAVKKITDAADGQFTERVNAKAAQLAAQQSGSDPRDVKLLAALRGAFGNNIGWLQSAEVISAIGAVQKLAKSGRYTALEATAQTLRTAADAMDNAKAALEIAHGMVEASPDKF